MDNNLEETANRFLRLSRRLRRLGSEDSQLETEITSPSHLALIEYAGSNPNCGVQEIAEALGLSTPTVSISVRQLEKSGLMTRKPDPTDGRAVQLSLTVKGKEIQENVRSFHCQKFQKLLSGLDPEERENLVRLLEKALDAAEKES